MKVEVSDLSPVKKSMVIEVEPDEVARERSAVLRGYQQRAKIPGFRPGKAPIDLVAKRFAKEVDEDVRERVLTRTYAKAARENGLTPIGNPILDEVEQPDGQPLRFKTTFEVLPVLEPRNYRGAEVRRPTVSVGPDEVERALDGLRRSRVRLVEAPSREAQRDDVVLADVQGTPIGGGETMRRERTMIQLGGEGNLPAFDEALLGVTAGEERKFEVAYPDDYPANDIAGKRVAWEVRVHEIKRQEFPDLDDEFARDLGDFENLDALRARARADLEARRAHEADQAVRQSVLDKVLLENPVVLPDGLVEDETRRGLERMVRGFIAQGIDPEKLELDWEDLRRRQAESARRMVHARLLLDAIARAESVSASDQELTQRIRHEAAHAGRKFEEVMQDLKKRSEIELVRAQMVREKTLDYLTSVANIHDEGRA